MKLKVKKRLFAQLNEIEDFRVHTGKIEYPLAEILFMALFGLLKGRTTFKDLHNWMEFNADNRILLRVFGKKGVLDIPSVSTLHHILINVDNDALEKVFRNFFSKYVTKKNIAVDGKWLNGSDVNGQYTQESHKAILNILDKDQKIVIGHKFLKKGKLSEIPAFKEVLNDGSFCTEGQIFSFDALLTQSDILNTINNRKDRYIAKVKGNQKALKEKVKLTVSDFASPSQRYESEAYRMENNKDVYRVVEIFQSSSCDIVMYSSSFDNIQTLIRITKSTTDRVSGEIKTTVEHLIANFKTTAKKFHAIILQHWRVETYHYHLDKLTKEDDHIAYIDPFSIAILRSFAVNLYQLFFNKYKGEKIIVGDVQTRSPLIMADCKRYSQESDRFIADLFEL